MYEALFIYLLDMEEEYFFTQTRRESKKKGRKKKLFHAQGR